MAREKEHELKARGYDDDFLHRAKRMLHEPGISVVKDALTAIEAGRVHAMHDPTEGGLATGLYELAWAGRVGIEVEYERIPFVQEGLKLCAEFGLDPLGTIASGALLIVVHPNDVDAILSALRDVNINAQVVGTVIEPEQGVLLKRGGEATPLPLFVKDEIAKLF
ncbi:MAG TPA: hypothetical protein EYP10_06915 [Armatimonadetes bacterium]|nr:hypothetical protein [Armatimonadota bacterium]